jgi:hypothetical protein
MTNKNKLERDSLVCEACGSSGGLMLDCVQLTDLNPQQDTAVAAVFMACDCCGHRFAVEFNSHGGSTSIEVTSPAQFDGGTSLRVARQTVTLEWDRGRQPEPVRLKGWGE